MIPTTYGYARVNKPEDTTRNLETQLRILQEYGIREEHIFADEMTGSSMSRPAWNELMAGVRPNDTIVVAWLTGSADTSMMGCGSRRSSPSRR